MILYKNYIIYLLFNLLNNESIKCFEQNNNEIKPIINNKFNNSCPNEYKMCKCDYIETLHSNLNIFSIKINCQSDGHHHHRNNNHNTIDTVTKKQQIQNEKLSVLLKINISNYPHVNLINQLELSRTLIKEIPTDAFQVIFFSFRFNLKYNSITF